MVTASLREETNWQQRTGMKRKIHDRDTCTRISHNRLRKRWPAFGELMTLSSRVWRMRKHLHTTTKRWDNEDWYRGDKCSLQPRLLRIPWSIFVVSSPLSPCLPISCLYLTRHTSPKRILPKKKKKRKKMRRCHHGTCLRQTKRKNSVFNWKWQ